MKKITTWALKARAIGAKERPDQEHEGEYTQQPNAEAQEQTHEQPFSRLAFTSTPQKMLLFRVMCATTLAA